MLMLGIGAIIFYMRGPPEEKPPREKYEKDLGSICCLIPVLLEHEAAIIIETLSNALAIAEFELVVLTFNTRGGDPRGTPVMGELEALQAQYPKRLVLQYNEASTSKAGNLNEAMEHTKPYEFAILLDADHIITPESVAKLAAAIRGAPEDTACMQGAVLVRGESCWAQGLTTVSWYFGNIVMTAFEVISGTCNFIGAAAVWRSEVLRELKFRAHMTSEDDDLGLRANIAGAQPGLAPFHAGCFHRFVDSPMTSDNPFLYLQPPCPQV